jgi:hypothetical protein
MDSKNDGDDDDDELSKLETEIQRLRIQIAAIVGRENELVRRGYGDASQSRMNCPLRNQLERSLLNQAKREELARVKGVQRDAVKSGMVERHSQENADECPLCLVGKYSTCVTERYSCCGGWCCQVCKDEMSEKLIKTTTALDRADSVAEFTELTTQSKILSRCPFCRARLVEGSTKNRHQEVMTVALAGKAWAQACIGRDFHYGRGGVPKDIQAAQQWLTLAAYQGDQAALTELLVIWFEGSHMPEPEACDKAWKLAWPNARLGNLPPRLCVGGCK